MPPVKNNPQDNQADKFREAARELGCDEDEERFEETVKKVAKTPRPNPVTPSESDR